MENDVKMENQELISNNTSRIYGLQQQIYNLEDEKARLEADYRIKCEEEEEARAILSKRLAIANSVAQMKKSKLTDKLAEKIELWTSGAETSALINCYIDEKDYISKKLDRIKRSIEQKRNEIYSLQREIWELE